MLLRYFLVLPAFVSFLTINAAQGTVQKPDAFLPHRLGEQFTPHAMLTEYYAYLAINAPQTMKLERYGATNEARPLQLAFFSSPENIRQLEQYRLNNLRLAGMGSDNTKGDPANMPAIVWLNMSVHGNEPSGAECSMLLAWQLATQTESDIQEWLKNTIVIIDPSSNPDGYDRYTHWYRSVSNRLKNPHGKSREHDEPWPGGRTNHYLFDLNRDWAWATQAETRQRLDIFQQWLPHVVADLHEQYVDDPYYFAPAAEPMHAFITPWQREFQQKIGDNHARYFDQNGWLYFTNEVFDLLYPSYGDTYPMFNGAIGMTYEQAGHSTAGRAIITANNDTLTLHDRILHHLTTSRSTIETASKNARQLVDQFQDFYAKAQTNPPGRYGAFVLKSSNDPNRINQLCHLLDRHKIRYGRAGTSTTAKGFDYISGKETTYTVQPEDLVISAYQPKAVLTQVLFEPAPFISDSLTYDITAWALPYSFGLDAFAAKQRIEPKKNYEPFKATEIVLAASPYAWCVARTAINDYAWAADLTAQGVKLRYATEAFTMADQQFEAGTFIVNRADNRSIESTLDGLVKSAAQKANVSLHPIFTGFINKGAEMGSSKYHLLNAPSVAVVYGEEVDDNAFGQIWYFFEQELGYPVDMIRSDKVNSVSLQQINTLVLPNGGYRFDEGTLTTLKEWISEGGRLIAFEGGCKMLAGKPGFEWQIKNEEYKERDSTASPSYQMSERYHISDQSPGAIIKTQVDPTHPLSYGLGNAYFTLKTNSNVYQLSNKLSTAIRIPNQFDAYGFIGCRFKPHLQNSPVAAIQQMGNGTVVYFADNPLFRSFWQTGKMLFTNALFF